MEHGVGSFYSLLLVITLALVAPLLAHSLRRWRLPVVVLEIAVGAFFGKSGFNLISADSHISFLSSFGFAYLMFLSGLEMDVQELFPAKDENSSFFRSPLALSVARLVVVFILAVAGSLVIEKMGLIEDGFFVAFLICNTSVGIVVSVLKEYHIISTPGGQLTLTATLLADLLSVFALSSYVAFTSSNRGEVEFFLILMLMVMSVLIYRFIKFSKGKAGWLDSAFHSMAKSTSQVSLRATFALLLFFIAFAEFMGTEVMLGALLSGIVTSVLLGREGETLKEKLDVIGYGFFVPIFFIMVGANLDLSVLFRSPKAVPLILILLFMVLTVNLAGSIFFVKSFGVRNGIAYGLMMTTRLALTVAGASIGMQAGIISQTTMSALIILSVITCVMGPALFLKIHRSDEADDSSQIWVVAGNTLWAINMAEQLDSVGLEIYLVTSNRRVKKIAEKKGLSVVFRLNDDPQAVVDKLGKKPDGVVLDIRKSDRVVEVSRVLKYHYGIDRIIATCRNSRTSLLLKDIGVLAVSLDEALFNFVKQSIASPTLFYSVSGEECSVMELKININDDAQKVKLGEVEDHAPASVTFLFIYRDGSPLPFSREIEPIDGDILVIKSANGLQDGIDLMESISDQWSYTLDLSHREKRCSTAKMDG